MRFFQHFVFGVIVLHLVASEIEASPGDVLRKDVEQVDQFISLTLEKNGLKPSAICTDEVFLRRVFFDLIGTLPSADEVRTWLSDSSKDKRERLINHLIDRPEFADYWTLKWCDLLRVKSEFPINLWPNGVQAYHRWIHTAIRENWPYDRFALDLLTSSGSNFRDPAVNFYRSAQSQAPEAIARIVALTFMGARTERWSKSETQNLAKFFSKLRFKPTKEWKEEIVHWLPGPIDEKDLETYFPDGSPVRIPPTKDPREVLAKWLLTPSNPWFAKTIVNRIWFWLLGHGLIHEPDDIRSDNPASHPELLRFLERYLVRQRFDTRAVFRLILNSNTYQRTAAPAEDPKTARFFAHYYIRRLPAEVLIDAICQISGTTEEYSSAIPEPFTFIPRNRRSINLADGSIRSSFLDIFGRPARDTGREFERDDRITPAQRTHLLNSTHIQEKIRATLAHLNLRRFQRRPAEALDLIFLTILSRRPTPKELVTLFEKAKASGDGTFGEDLIWALINSDEFLFRH